MIYSPADKKSWVEVFKGGVRFTLIKAFNREWRITTNSIVAAVRGTDFLIEKGDNGQTTLTVLSGKVAASDPQGKNTVEVVGGYQTSTSINQPPTQPQPIDQNKLNKWYEPIEQKLKNKSPVSPALSIGIGLIILLVLIMAIKLIRKKSKSK